jgi:uncharacterized protein
MAQLFDRATIKGSARITSEGYLVADALVARANNIQVYTAGELGIADRDSKDPVRVFRPEGVVFATDTLRSASRLPVTLDHPTTMVDARNYREFARGETGEEIMRDGEFMRVPIRVTDAQAVDSIVSDRQEFSLGYAAAFDFTPGEFDGQAYDAALTSIRYNHLAACRAARGGAELRIVDERPADRRKPAPTPPVSDQHRNSGVRHMHVLMIDGLQVTEVSDQAKAAIEKLQGQIGTLTDAKTTAETQVATLTTEKATLDAKVVTLEQQLKDSKLTPQQLRDAAKAYQVVADKAKALGVAVTDAMDEPAIMKAVVDAKLGAAAAGWNEAQIAASFATIAGSTVTDSVRDVITATPIVVGDAAAKEHAAYVKASDHNAWRTAGAAV